MLVYDATSGAVTVAKGPTTPGRPEVGVKSVIASAVPDELLRRSSLFLHGSTVALNALLERRGAIVGLLTTQGFRDVLEIRRGERDSVNDVRWRPPEPLVRRELRIGIRERVLADGRVETSPSRADIAAALATFQAADVTSIALTFLNAYVNPHNELEAEQHIRDLGFEGEIALSHRISREYREYERTSTTVIDAYVRPLMATYLGRLEGDLGDLGFSGDCLITTSGGGAISFEEAEARPFETIQSGPVAGAVGAGELARVMELSSAVTADVGGTSFDTCLVLDGRPERQYEGSVVGMPIQAPWVDVRSIGAGGGSIAYVDHGGLLRVGPRSAGADPGPACYLRGGSEATVTDAALHLGMLGFGELAAGMLLDRSAADAALGPVAAAIGLALDETAIGVMTIAAAAMANAIREITLEQGHDPRDAALIAFGGAGPLFATLLARDLGVTKIVIPPYAGNFSAWGLLVQDLVLESSRTVVCPLDTEGVERVRVALDALFAELTGRRAEASGAEGTRKSAALDIRFVGQEYTLTVPIDAPLEGATLDTEAIRTRFVADYKRTFGHAMDDPAEIVAVRAALREPLPSLRSTSEARDAVTHAARKCDAYSFAEQRRLSFAVVDRSAVSAEIHGPAIVLEETSTTYVDAGYVCTPHTSGALVLEREAS